VSDDFGTFTLPYCSFTAADADGARVGVGVGTSVLDLTAAAATVVPAHAHLFAAGTLDVFMAAGADAWHKVREALLVGDLPAEHLRGQDEVRLVMPFAVADYVDFYASEHHASNLGRIFRPDSEPLTPNWKHLPIGYHGRSGTVVVSGTTVVRPCGQRRAAGGDITVGPSARLDIEAELGFVVGAASDLGTPVGVEDFARHVFGVCLVNDWSARDIQAWEYVPLGPFLGKSFATSISPWIVPLAALDTARIAGPTQDPTPVDYLVPGEPWGLDIALEVELNGEVISRPPFAEMYWTGAQMLAHMTANGASLRTGDLFASGTISGPGVDQRGALIEITWNGTEPITVADGSQRGYLEDGDSVVIRATAPGPGGQRVVLGAVEGTIAPARDAS